MIKKISLISLFFWFISFNVWAENISAPSIITEVTVYPGSAHVTRQVKMNLSVGEHSIVLENIIPQLDENSITVSGQGQAEVKIFGAHIKKEYLTEAASERVKELEGRIESLEDQISLESNNLDILKQQKEFLDSVRLFSGEQIPKDLVTAMPTTERLKETLDFLTTQSRGIENKKEEIRIKVRDLEKEKENLKKTLAESRSGKTDLKRSIAVDIECAKAGSFSLNIAYLVYGANWRSIYDARVYLEKGAVELTSFGMIKQTTGEDWENVKIYLSTAKPTLGGRMPYVSSWILQEYKTEAIRANKKGRLRTAADDIGDQFQYEPYYLEQEYVVAEKEAEVSYAQAAEKGISVIYEIARPVTVKSDGTEQKYPIVSQNLKANFEYSSFPRAQESAYLGSVVTNAKDLQLLAGEVNLFLEGSFVGKSSIDNIGPGEEFNLYLGVDENVKVKRELISQKKDDVLLAGIPSSTIKTTFQYKLTVENYKNKKINMHLFEAMPVSENERIKVKVLEMNVAPNEKDWKDRKGIWHWAFELEPQVKKEIIYSFVIEHPKEMKISGL